MEDKVLVGDQAPQEPEVQADVVEIPVEAPVEEPALLAGKFKDVADLEKSYSELQAKLGDQGNRLGKAEEERSMLLKQLEGIKTSNQSTPEAKGEAEDLAQQINAIAQQVEYGDLTIGEGMKQTAVISAKIAQQEAVKGIHEAQSKATIEQSKKVFAEENKDFFELQKSGELDAIKNKLPGFHDDISAYYALKANAAQSALEVAVDAAKKEGIEMGKAEMAKIAGGDQNTQKVLQGGGESAAKIGREKGTMNANEIRESGLAALKRVRGG